MMPQRNINFILRILKLVIFNLLLSTFQHHLVDASEAARTETLVGIVGKDFVLLMADSSASQGLALQASNLDKIAALSDPFPDGSPPSLTRKRQMAISAAAAGDPADTDRLITILKAFAVIEEFQNGWGCDVRRISSSPSVLAALTPPEGPGLDVQAMAHFARRTIAGSLRSSPLRVCLLIAGMKLVGKETSGQNRMEGNGLLPNEIGIDKIAHQYSGHVSSMVQQQVKQAWDITKIEDHENKDELETSAPNGFSTISSAYQPRLYWLDEYGSMQQVPYGVHGFGSNLLLSILDRTFRPNMTLPEATALMQECFQELRHRFVINSPQEPCLKCIDAQGIHWIPFSDPSNRG
jgi:20S proteasome subunit beta 4